MLDWSDGFWQNQKWVLALTSVATLPSNCPYREPQVINGEKYLRFMNLETPRIFYMDYMGIVSLFVKQEIIGFFFSSSNIKLLFFFWIWL